MRSGVIGPALPPDGPGEPPVLQSGAPLAHTCPGSRGQATGTSGALSGGDTNSSPKSGGHLGTGWGDGTEAPPFADAAKCCPKQRRRAGLLPRVRWPVPSTVCGGVSVNRPRGKAGDTSVAGGFQAPPPHPPTRAGGHFTVVPPPGSLNPAFPCVALALVRLAARGRACASAKRPAAPLLPLTPAGSGKDRGSAGSPVGTAPGRPHSAPTPSLPGS